MCNVTWLAFAVGDQINVNGTMPASSADSFDAIEQTLQAAFNGPSTSCNDMNLDEKLMTSAKKVLLSKIEFQPAEKNYSFTLKNLKSKYIHLNPDGKRNNCEMQNGNGFNNHNANMTTDEDGIPNPRVMIHPADKVTLGWQRVYRIGAGLMNMGNTCFLNAILQCLTYTPPLVNHLIEFDEHAAYCKTVGFCMMCELFRHIRRALEKNGETIKPQCILQKLKAIAKHMVWGRQEDAHEFLRYVMESMIKSSLKGYSPTNLDRISLETTVVNQIFGGYHRSQVTCLQCKSKSDTYDHFMDIILDIKTVPSLEKAMEKFIQPEVLDKDNSYLCPRCKQKCPAQKKFTIHRAPNVATFQLKRFDYNRMVGGKITKTITFPEKLDLRPYMSQQHGPPVMYQLYAVLVHQGVSCNSGHYFCFVRNSNNLWYCMDDCRIRQVSLNLVLAQQAYLLFYARLPNNNNYNCKLSANNASNNTMNGNYEKRNNTTVTTNNINNNNNTNGNGASNINISNNNNARNRIAGGLLTTNREKISFGLKTAAALNSTDTDSKHPRIVMQIKHGKVTSLEQPWTPTNGQRQYPQLQQNLHNQQNRISNLVPYIPDSSEESDQESRNGKEKVATTTTSSAPASTTTSSSLSSTTVISLPPESSCAANESDKTNPLAVMTASTTPVGANKIKATSSWVVTDGNQNSPSIASECSVNSINSTTTDWIITEKDDEKNQKGERNYPGWIVTANKENDKCSFSTKRLAHRLLGGKEKSDLKCHDDDSQLLIERKIRKDTIKCHSDTETQLSGNRQYYRREINNDNDNNNNSSSYSAEERVPSLSSFENGKKRGRHKEEEEENHKRADENEAKKTKYSGDDLSLVSNGHRSDSADENSKSKRHKKRRKQIRERYKQDDESKQSENSESSSTVKERKRKHRKHEYQSDSSSDESSYELEWVERTKETMEEEKKWNKMNKRQDEHWQERINDKDAHRHQQQHTRHNGVSDLFKNSHQGYGAKVSSWNGGQSLLDRNSPPWKRRNDENDYDAEYDKGRVKKNKFHRRSFDTGYNPFQRFQTTRNNSDASSQARSSSFHSFDRKTTRHYHNNNNYHNHHLKQHYHIKQSNKF